MNAAPLSLMDANLRLERVVAGQLPAFNSAYLANELTLEELVELIGYAVVGLVGAVDRRGIGGLTITDRERVMTTLGFITGTVERGLAPEPLRARKLGRLHKNTGSPYDSLWTICD